MTIPRMTVRSMWKIIGMIIRIENGFDFTWIITWPLQLLLSKIVGIHTLIERNFWKFPCSLYFQTGVFRKHLLAYFPLCERLISGNLTKITWTCVKTREIHLSDRGLTTTNEGLSIGLSTKNSHGSCKNFFSLLFLSEKTLITFLTWNVSIWTLIITSWISTLFSKTCYSRIP